MLRTTLEQIQRSFETVSKDETRPQLCGVLLERTEVKEVVQITSSDGHKLFTTPVIDEELYHAMESRPFIILDSSAKVMIAAALKVNKKTTRYPIVMGDEHMHTWATTFTILKRVYPRYRQFIPSNKREVKHVVSFNVQNLVAITKAAGKHQIVTLELGEYSTPIFVKIKGMQDDATAILMPCKL